MKTKTLMIALAAATALSAGAASAQPYGYDRRDAQAYGRHDGGRWMSINDRQERLDRRIDQGVRSGQITRNEAYRLRSEFRRIANLEARYRYNGFSNWERADLDRRFDVLQQQIRYERRDDDRRYGYDDDRRYGYNDYRR